MIADFSGSGLKKGKLKILIREIRSDSHRNPSNPCSSSSSPNHQITKFFGEFHHRFHRLSQKKLFQAISNCFRWFESNSPNHQITKSPNHQITKFFGEFHHRFHRLSQKKLFQAISNCLRWFEFQSTNQQIDKSTNSSGVSNGLFGNFRLSPFIFLLVYVREESFLKDQNGRDADGDG